jgi:hypothetical protein
MNNNRKSPNTTSHLLLHAKSEAANATAALKLVRPAVIGICAQRVNTATYAYHIPISAKTHVNKYLTNIIVASNLDMATEFSK